MCPWAVIGFGKAVVDLGPQRRERNRTGDRLFAPRHFRTAQAAGQLNLDPLRAGFHRGFHGPLHAAAEAGPLGQLLGDVLGHQLGLNFRPGDFLDLDVDPPADQVLQLALQPLDLLPLAADDDARPRGVQDDLDFVAGPLDFDLGNAGEPVLVLDEVADLEVLDQQVRKNSCFEAYQRLFQPIMMPVRKPVGLTF